MLKCLNGSSRVDLYPAGSERCKVSQRSKHSLFTLKRVLGFLIGGSSPRMCPAFQDSELSGPDSEEELRWRLTITAPSIKYVCNYIRWLDRELFLTAVKYAEANCINTSLLILVFRLQPSMYEQDKSKLGMN